VCVCAYVCVRACVRACRACAHTCACVSAVCVLIAGQACGGSDTTHLTLLPCSAAYAAACCSECGTPSGSRELSVVCTACCVLCVVCCVLCVVCCVWCMLCVACCVRVCVGVCGCVVEWLCVCVNVTANVNVNVNVNHNPTPPHAHTRYCLLCDSISAVRTREATDTILARGVYRHFLVFLGSVVA
jgi:hypothetical protein